MDGVYEYVIKPVLHEFASFAFEDVCREFISQKQKKNELPFRYTKMGRWFGKTTVRDTKKEDGLRTAETEIDVLCIDRMGENSIMPYFLKADLMRRLLMTLMKMKLHFTILKRLWGLCDNRALLNDMV